MVDPESGAVSQRLLLPPVEAGCVAAPALDLETGTAYLGRHWVLMFCGGKTRSVTAYSLERHRPRCARGEVEVMSVSPSATTIMRTERSWREAGWRPGFAPTVARAKAQGSMSLMQASHPAHAAASGEAVVTAAKRPGNRHIPTSSERARRDPPQLRQIPGPCGPALWMPGSVVGLRRSPAAGRPDLTKAEPGHPRWRGRLVTRPPLPAAGRPIPDDGRRAAGGRSRGTGSRAGVVALPVPPPAVRTPNPNPGSPSNPDSVASVRVC